MGYPDRMGFGRRHIQMELGELEKHVLYQLGALDGLARPASHRITHMNPHGALGNLACADRAVAEIMTHAVVAAHPDDGIIDVIRKLEHHEISAMPVVDGHAVVGMVSTDLLARRSLLRLLQSLHD